MTTGRKLRLAFVSIVALLFGVVTIAHTKAHAANDGRAEAACTLCQHATAQAPDPVQVAAPVPVFTSVVIAEPCVVAVETALTQTSRGPPAA